jgi:hypothetical protein
MAKTQLVRDQAGSAHRTGIFHDPCEYSKQNVTITPTQILYISTFASTPKQPRPSGLQPATGAIRQTLGRRADAGAILDCFLHHAQTIAITGTTHGLKDHAAIAGKEDKNKKCKSKPNEPSTAEPAS